MKATRHNGRAGKHGAYNPKHNDREFDEENSEHIDAERTKFNVYWDCYQGYSLPNAENERAKFTFTEVEKAYYVEHYSEHVDGQNERNRKARHYDRVKTIDGILTNTKTCPEETLLQLGNIDGTVSADEFGIAYDSSVRSPPKPVRREKSPMQILAETKTKTYRVLSDYLHLLKDWKRDFEPKSMDEIDARYEEAVNNLPKVEYQLDIMLWGTEEEKEMLLRDLGKEVADIERRVNEHRRNQGTIDHNRQRSCEAVH